ncbi:MAG: reverse transcriptase domain-containing protein [Bacteroidales bacterium]
MSSRVDLLALLNQIKQSDMELRGLSGKFHPFTEKHITYYCNPNNVFHRYRTFEVKKKSGGMRKITSPRNRSYKYMLSCINEILKSLYTPSTYAMGFTERRSVVTNAGCHKEQNYVYNIDLKDFFPSIDQARVWKRLQLQPFNFPVAVANVIAGICAMREEIDQNDEQKKYRYVLPQGAPTSPIITNMICDKLDRRLAGLAKRFGLNFTRYADDITFSSMHNVYQSEGKFIKELHRIITDQGFTINDSKTRLQKRGTRQEVTGIIVSNKLNVTQKYMRDIRNILYMWDRYGYQVAYSKFFPMYKAEKGHIKKGTPNLVSVIDGKLMYMKMVKGENDSTYIKLYTKFMHLADSFKTQSKESKKTVFLDTIPLLKFEKLSNISVNIYIHISHTDMDGYYTDIPTEVRTANYQLECKEINVVIDKQVTAVDKKDELSISTCRNAKGKEYRLLHRTDKLTPQVKPQNIDIETLNQDLDSLLNDTPWTTN